MTPAWGTIDMVGFKVYRAARLEGEMRDPSVSLPKEKGAYPAATETADPEDDPDVFWMIREKRALGIWG